MYHPSPFLVTVFALASALWLSSAANAQTMYKYVDANGKTVYSDHAPPAGVKFETIHANTKPTGVDLRTNGSGQTDAYVRGREAKEAKRNELVADAQQNYDSAVAELEAAKVPREGDRTQNSNGTSRLNDSYTSRVAALEKKVEEMRIKLEQAKRD